MSQYSTEALSTLLKNINSISHEVSYVPEFKNDTENLTERFETINHDIKVFIEIGLKLYHELNVDNEGIKPVKSLKDGKIYQAEKFACRAIKGKGAKSGIKVIYAHFENKKKIELIEIFFSQDKDKHDENRIHKYYKH